MSDSPWSELSGLFEQALEVMPDERSEFLERACHGDAVLLARLESMLQADGLDDQFIAPPEELTKLERERTGADVASPLALLGLDLGAWRLEEHIDSGGMGDVYLARRSDDAFEKTAAVKVLKRGLDTNELLRRFELERHALGALEHPGIARLIDAGVVPDGRPYILVEHVDGVPIDRYCDVHELDLVQRIRLFREVCRSASHAHNHLILHCDLKPANILVTQDGKPKLLDFGIAKLLDTDSPTLTRTHAPRPMTLEYACPESVRGETLSMASDVYSLGVVLYELLTGCSPYLYESHAELARAVAETVPRRPSTAATSRDKTERASGGSKLRLRRLGGDLDTIILMALRKEPDRRYPTVDQFSEDLGRFLEGQCVKARPATLGYVSSRFVLRHRWALLAAGAVLSSLATGYVGLSWRTEEIRVERDKALVAREQAEDARTTMALALDAEEAARQAADTARLDADVARQEAIASRERAERVNIFLEDILASPGPDRLGRQGSLRDVLEYASAEVATRFSDRPWVEASVRSVLGRTWLELGRLEEAEGHLERALALRESLVPADHPRLAESLDELGQLRFTQQDPERALSLFSRALASWRGSAGDRSAEVALALNNSGAALNALGELDRAEEALDEAIAIRREVLGDEDAAVAETLTNLASTYRRRGDLDEAEAVLQEALRIRRAVYGPEHHLVAQSLSNLAVACMQMTRFDEAAELLTRSVAIQRRVLGDRHPEVATDLSNLGSLHQLRGDYEAARQALAECVEVRRVVFAADSQPVIAAEVRLGVVLVIQKRFAEAEPLLLPGANRFVEAHGPEDRQSQNVLEALARLYDGTGRAEAARAVRARLLAPPGDSSNG